MIAPTSVVTVWRDEAARFGPSLNVVLWHGPPNLRHQIDLTHADLVITSYGILRRDAERLSAVPFRYVILDEAQAAKNAATQNAKAVRQLVSERRLALSGTPIENRSEELWAAFDFLAPGFLGSLRQFRKRYGRPVAQGDDGALDRLRARVAPLILRRLKSEVARELPPKIETTVRCDMQSSQRALYDHMAGKLRETVLKKIEKIGIERAHLDILAALTRLRQICCDPALLPTPEGVKTPPSAKLELFEELMREALGSERRVVVFSQFVKMQRRLISTIKKLGVEPLWLHGGTKNRDKVVDAFQTPSGPPVIVVSLRAGGTGLTLTRADTVMHYDPWWNPAVERQATDRTHRLGQRQKVTVYKLICANTIEEKVHALAASKDKLAESLISSEGSAASKHITTDEVLALLQ
ncbi:MAG: DEAD/DEAH box helicase [Myxococcota bacterium]